MANIYDIGNVVACSSEDRTDPDSTKWVLGFTRDGVLVDPEDVFFTCTKPDGTTLQYHYGVDVELVRISVGLYVVYVNCDVASISIPYEYRFYSTGTNQAAKKNRFFVRP